MGAVLWVDEVIATPSTYTGTVASITDQSHGSGWNDIVLSETSPTLTLGWNTAFTNDGTGVIKITSGLRLYPDPTGSGFDIRLLLEDNTYSDVYTVSASSALKVLDTQAKKYVMKQTILIDDIYDGPLAVKGIEFTNLNPNTSGGNAPFSLWSVTAEVPPEPDEAPEPSSTLLVGAGALAILARRRK